MRTLWVEELPDGTRYCAWTSGWYISDPEAEGATGCIPPRNELLEGGPYDEAESAVDAIRRWYGESVAVVVVAACRICGHLADIRDIPGSDLVCEDCRKVGYSDDGRAER